ncbi:MAG: hypothetical protein KAV87_28790, partial [Desulfobacteraceae bacterium]|nr:hypothetical protein [Desulfobacteraceae bacterium]
LGIHFAVDDGDSVSGTRLPQQSLIFFRRALALNPDNLMAGNNLAVAAALQGGIKFATEKLSRLLALYSGEKNGCLDRNLKMAGNGSRKISDYCWCFNESCKIYGEGVD